MLSIALYLGTLRLAFAYFTTGKFPQAIDLKNMFLRVIFTTRYCKEAEGCLFVD